MKNLNAVTILSLRPRYFGKTLFLSTLSSYYDIKNKGNRFKQLFGDLYIGKTPTELAVSFLVLELNFAGLYTSRTYDIFDEDFHENLNRDFLKFIYKYQQELGDFFYEYNKKKKKNALSNFKELLNAVEFSGNKLYICIDEYDASINEALKNDAILKPFIAHQKKEVYIVQRAQSKVELMESSFKQFYSKLKDACNKNLARVFQTGVTPVIMANIDEDLTLGKEFWDLYGFKKSEVELLLDNALGLSPDVKRGIMEWLKEENDGYFFNPKQTEELLNAVEFSGNKLYICIDEYDASINEALKNDAILKPFIAHQKKEVYIVQRAQSKVELMESSFKQFYSKLKDACNKNLARVFQTGVTPVIMANIDEDLTLGKEFWDLYGFKKSEVELLLDNALGLSPDVKRGIMEWLKEENDGYFFNPKQTEGIFNPAHILYCIKKLMGNKKDIDNDNQDTSIIIKKLLEFPSDPQTLPSQTTLDLIVNNPLGKSILTEALNQCPLKLKKDIEQRFRLSNIYELATDRIPLLSFMFYTGALTYKPRSPGSLKYELQIPNRIAKREFIAEALKIYNWKEEDLISVRRCLQTLEGEDNIEPLCRFIEKTLLEPLKDNSVVHSNEEALKQTFMNAFILTHNADIEPEFQVSDFSGKAIDLVKTSTEERIAIEFGNIKIGDIDFNDDLRNWQKATQVSLSLLKKSEDEILDLKTIDFKTSNRNSPNFITIRKLLDNKIKQCNDYLSALKKRDDKKLKSMFIVLRVGLHRLISRRVYCFDE
ncbi:hypothetical protein Glove_426g58 [Diversispora epigaea]|uniref:AAA-ATPase-like domain-containing protein n=1 Tax=Diversispora epigaea TaxID=1348612 RepID=A0A397GU60_9GLOM|nr:hypothetical protein Glove_426g58 [Diversispora epigaea]